jgi:valyl-tRNA synthetase
LRFTTIFLTPTGQTDSTRSAMRRRSSPTRSGTAKLEYAPIQRARIPSHASLTDRWILSRYARCVRDTTRYLKTTGQHAANAVYRFAWTSTATGISVSVKPRWSDEGAVADPVGAHRA